MLKLRAFNSVTKRWRWVNLEKLTKTFSFTQEEISDWVDNTKIFTLLPTPGLGKVNVVVGGYWTAVGNSESQNNLVGYLSYGSYDDPDASDWVIAKGIGDDGTTDGSFLGVIDPMSSNKNLNLIENKALVLDNAAWGTIDPVALTFYIDYIEITL